MVRMNVKKLTVSTFWHVHVQVFGLDVSGLWCVHRGYLFQGQHSLSNDLTLQPLVGLQQKVEEASPYLRVSWINSAGKIIAVHQYNE